MPRSGLGEQNLLITVSGQSIAMMALRGRMGKTKLIKWQI
jgi:hypothetical protein